MENKERKERKEWKGLEAISRPGGGQGKKSERFS